MSRKLELIKMANMFRSQAKAVSRRSTKKALRKLANYYQHEAEQLESLQRQSVRGRPKSAA